MGYMGCSFVGSMVVFGASAFITYYGGWGVLVGFCSSYSVTILTISMVGFDWEHTQHTLVDMFWRLYVFRGFPAGISGNNAKKCFGDNEV